MASTTTVNVSVEVVRMEPAVGVADVVGIEARWAVEPDQLAAVLAGAVVLASIISVEIGLSVALIELALRVVFGNAFGLDPNAGWLVSSPTSPRSSWHRQRTRSPRSVRSRVMRRHGAGCRAT
jgi:hypothetical protein